MFGNLTPFGILKFWTSRYLREPQYGYEKPKLSHIVPLPLIHLSISLHLGLSQPISAWVHCCLDALNQFCKLTIKNLLKLNGRETAQTISIHKLRSNLHHVIE